MDTSVSVLLRACVVGGETVNVETLKVGPACGAARYARPFSVFVAVKSEGGRDNGVLRGIFLSHYYTMILGDRHGCWGTDCRGTMSPRG